MPALRAAVAADRCPSPLQGQCAPLCSASTIASLHARRFTAALPQSRLTKYVTSTFLSFSQFWHPSTCFTLSATPATHRPPPVPGPPTGAPKRSKIPFSRSVRLNPRILGKANRKCGHPDPGGSEGGPETDQDLRPICRPVVLPHVGVGGQTVFYRWSPKGVQNRSRFSLLFTVLYRGPKEVKSDVLCIPF